MRRGGAGKRRDRNEPAIVEALRAIGVEVWQLHGEGLPDLLCRFRGRPYAFEVKTAQGRRTSAQEATRWPIVRDVEEALRALGVSET